MNTPPVAEAMTALRRGMEQLVVRQRDCDLDEMFALVVATGLDVVPGAAGGGITRIEDGEVHAEFASDEAVARLDGYQAQLAEGPCVHAATRPPEHGMVVAVDLDGVDVDRWPRFAPLAVRLGFRSMMSVNLLTPRKNAHYALNFFGRTADGFGEQDRVVAGMYGLQAAAVLNGTHRAQQLRVAVASRDTIGQAKGILMERFTIDEDDAFAMLRTSSQETNLKLKTVAGWLVAEANQRGEDAGGNGTAPRVVEEDERERS